MEAKFDKDGYLSGVTLTPQQMKQMVGLANERYAADIAKSRAEAKYMGAKDDGPERLPNESVRRFYFNAAGKDPAKAKQMAAEAGWTVQ